MEFNSLRLFLSEENIKRHVDHVNTVRLKYSILEKSEPSIVGKSMYEISKMNISSDIKCEAINLLRYIRSHRVYFESFCEKSGKSDALIKSYASKESFLYSLYELARKETSGFLYVYKDRHGKVFASIDSNDIGAFIKRQPILAIDLFEHSYFCDYYFNKERYLRSALSHLNISKLG